MMLHALARTLMDSAHTTPKKRTISPARIGVLRTQVYVTPHYRANMPPSLNVDAPGYSSFGFGILSSFDFGFRHFLTSARPKDHK